MRAREARHQKGIDLERRLKGRLGRKMIPVDYVAPECGWPSDGGFDLIACNIAYQCKNHSTPVNETEREQAPVRFEHSDVDLLVIVSPSGFTTPFREFVKIYDGGVVLRDGRIVKELWI